MRVVDIIIKKRSGGELTEEEIRFLIRGYVNETIPAYQISSFLMAVYFQGMTPRETGFLTRQMIDSGETIDFSDIGGFMVDKHSTGGVGDKISMILAPIVAACGLKVPMMAGRALGHTGGTLDKLDSIEGYKTALTIDEFKNTIKDCGYSITGQTQTLVPADRLMYALRDVTGTVESVPLITASILSKKFAEGADALIFDVKCGSGAFMKTLEDARKLATSLVETGKSLGKKVVCILTDMNAPLGRMVGNFLEIEESVLSLKENPDNDVMKITHRLAGWMLTAGGVTESAEEGEALSRKTVDSGKALECFMKNTALQGGNPDKLLSQIGKRRAEKTYNLTASKEGYIHAINSYQVGLASVALGVGRNKTEDKVLFDVGIEFLKNTGDYTAKGDTICILYGETDEAINRALEYFNGAIYIEETPVSKKDIIIEEMCAL